MREFYCSVDYHRITLRHYFSVTICLQVARVTPQQQLPPPPYFNDICTSGCVITAFVVCCEVADELRLFLPRAFLDPAGCFSVISVLRGLMTRAPRAVTPVLYFLCIIMAEVAGEEDREKSTPLKGRRTYTAGTKGKAMIMEGRWY